MKFVAVTLAAAGLSLLSPFASAAVVDRWDVTEARIRLTPADEAGRVIDTEGFYGAAGRVLKLSALEGELDPSSGANYLTRRNVAEGESYDYFRFEMSVGYRLSYTLTDAESDEVVARETVSMRLTDGYYESEPQTSFETRTEGLRAYDDNEPLAVESFAMPYFSPGYVPYNELYFGSDEQGRTTLSYGGSETWGLNALTIAYGNGLQSEDMFGTSAYLSGTLILTPVPEPETAALLAAGVLGIALARRRRAA